jgi:hypothetical protein
MADTKISALPAATTPLAGTEPVPIVQGGATKKVPVSDLTAGRAVSALSVTTTNGSSIQGLTVGRGAGAVSSNAAFGDGALPVNTTGADNVSLGVATLATNLTGSRNTAVGSTSLLLNSTGSDNSAFGFYALFSSTGDQNTGAGRQALFSATGSNNTAIGYQAGSSLTTGSNCGFFGSGAQPSSATVSNEYTYGDSAVTNHRFVGGNLVIGTSGKGIDFSATPGTGTSELLSDYEEGTWTPAFAGWTGAPTFSAGRYVKIGSQVTVIVIGQSGINAGNEAITGLPFTNSNAVTPTGALKVFGSSILSSLCNIDQNATSINSFSAVTLTGNYWSLSVTYFVTF